MIKENLTERKEEKKDEEKGYPFPVATHEKRNRSFIAGLILLLSTKDPPHTHTHTEEGEGWERDGHTGCKQTSKCTTDNNSSCTTRIYCIKYYCLVMIDLYLKCALPVKVKTLRNVSILYGLIFFCLSLPFLFHLCSTFTKVFIVSHVLLFSFKMLSRKKTYLKTHILWEHW